MTTCWLKEGRRFLVTPLRHRILPIFYGVINRNQSTSTPMRDGYQCRDQMLQSKTRANDVNNYEFNVDTNSILDDDFRGNWREIFISKRKTLNKGKHSHSQELKHKKTDNNFSLRVFPSESSSPPSLAVVACERTFFINPLSTSIRDITCCGERPPLIDNLLFTSINWKTVASSSLSKILISSIPTLGNVFGPPGTTEVISTAGPCFISAKENANIKAKWTFTESHKDISEYQIGDVKMTMVTLFDPFINDNSNCKSDSAVVSYIFEYSHLDNISDNYEENTEKKLPLQFTWKDFPNVEQYISYISECKHKSATIKKLTSLAVLVCPNMLCFEKLCNFDHVLFDENGSAKGATNIVHITPCDIYNSQLYQNWIARFGPNCKHIVLNETGHKPVQLASKSDIFRSWLHLINPHFFPMYGNRGGLETIQGVMSSNYLHDNLEVSTNRERKHFQTNIQSLTGSVLYDIRQQILSVADLHLPSSDMCNEYHNCSMFPKLVALGTGSAYIHVQRSSSCYLIRIDEDTSVLIDCGDDSYSQILKHFGPTLTPQILSTIKAIVVTHKHVDHWIGLINLLRRMHFPNKKELFVILPRSIHWFLCKQASVYGDDIFDNMRLLAIESMDQGQEVAQLLHLSQFDLVPVDHGVVTYGVVLEHSEGWKIAYSSDTLPMCKSLIARGQNADLLIHDCLHINDSEKHLTVFKLHSNMRGAVATAHRMNAKHVMLTHFAPMLPIVPIDSLSIDEPYEGNILYSIDHMEVSLDQLRLFPDLHNSFAYFGILRSMQPAKDKHNLRVSRLNEDLYETYKTAVQTNDFVKV